MKSLVGYLRHGGRVYTVHVPHRALQAALGMASAPYGDGPVNIVTTIEVDKMPLPPANDSEVISFDR